MTEQRVKFSLRKKLIVFVTALALTTYSVSAFFIYYLQPQFFPNTEPFIFTIITFLLGILWSGILAAIFGTILTKPLQELEEVATRVADGNIGVDVVMPKSSDEIRSVAEAFQRMVVNLRSIVSQIEHNFDETVTTVERLSTETTTAKSQADQVAHTVEEIATGAYSTAIAIQSTAESIEDVRTLAVEVNDRAVQSSGRSEEMLRELTTTTTDFHSLAEGIRNMSAQSEATLSTIRDLDKTAKEIGEIVQLVGNIAEQTNLLALNASIEAARAGEHGAGFAVVADEVRTLADGSAQAVNGITELVTTIQRDVTIVVKEIEEQVQAATNEVSRATETSGNIEVMQDKVSEMASSVVAITTLIENQLEGIEATAIQSQEVSAIAEETSAGTQEVSATKEQQVEGINRAHAMAENLKVQSEQLHKVIHQFDLSK